MAMHGARGARVRRRRSSSESPPTKRCQSTSSTAPTLSGGAPANRGAGCAAAASSPPPPRNTAAHHGRSTAPLHPRDPHRQRAADALQTMSLKPCHEMRGARAGTMATASRGPEGVARPRAPHARARQPSAQSRTRGWGSRTQRGRVDIASAMIPKNAATSTKTSNVSASQRNIAVGYHVTHACLLGTRT